ncbi:MAG: TetR/AcrR family transcriptional regulator [Proteobacteria bacterium]|uniref:TetR/AcrR family transcriptional regulator n=1 Tax=Aquabacterium sp. TaxID=1872578 RepID=UPI0035C6C8CC|nr:TetR/AcrR family transcriptional regulator [Pseudomonadota bacterium]
MDTATPDTTPPPRRRYGGVLPEERQRLRRAKLIEGAIEVFGTKGFHAATVREVCVAAHLTERYFYESFKTLPQLFLATYAELREQLMALTLAALKKAEPTPLGMLEPGIRVFLEFIRDDPRRGRIMLVDSLAVNDEVAAMSGATARDYSAMMRQHLHMLVPRSRAEEVQLDLLADGMIGLNVLLAARWMQDGFVEPIDRVVATNLLPYQGLLSMVDAQG